MKSTSFWNDRMDPLRRSIDDALHQVKRVVIVVLILTGLFWLVGLPHIWTGSKTGYLGPFGWNATKPTDAKWIVIRFLPIADCIDLTDASDKGPLSILPSRYRDGIRSTWSRTQP